MRTVSNRIAWTRMNRAEWQARMVGRASIVARVVQAKAAIGVVWGAMVADSIRPIGIYTSAEQAMDHAERELTSSN